MSRFVLLLALAPLALACGGGGDGGGDACGGSGATMSPGESCLPCHSSFKMAGTVFVDGSAGACDGLSGVTVQLVGSNGTSTRTSNSAGNFYAPTNFGLPFTATLTLGDVVVSKDHADVPDLTGDCNGCHSPTGSVGVRLHLP